MSSAGNPDVYTHGHHDAVLRSHRWRTVANSAAYLVPRLRPGMRLLDVGCGPGTLTVDLADHVMPGGRVVGIDIAAAPIAEARAHAAAKGRGDVAFVIGDFREFGWTEPFDVVHAHQVLQHLSDPIGALRAMADLMGPNGILAVRDSDYAGMFWSPGSAELDRWRSIYLAVTEHNRADANAGRHLVRWAEAAGFENVEYTTTTWTFASAEDRRWWADLWADRCLMSSFAEQAVAYGIAEQRELREVAAGWRRWATQPAGVFVVPHGELILAAN